MEDLGFEIEQVSNEDARALEQSTGSKYEGIANKWREARENDEAIVIKDVDGSKVNSVRTFMYNAFDKNNVIVRSKRKGEDLFNIIIRERIDGEFLSDNQEDADETLPESSENGEEEAFSDEEQTEVVSEADDFMTS